MTSTKLEMIRIASTIIMMIILSSILNFVFNDTVAWVVFAVAVLAYLGRNLIK